MSLHFVTRVSGCLAAHLARNSTISEAIEKSVACASISVQYKGAQPSYARLESIDNDLRPPLKR
jgi:sugar/nucleoside kinase (ribokinase family)